MSPMYRNTSPDPHPATGGGHPIALVPAVPPRARRGPRVHRRARSESGQAFVELAFLLPILFLLAMGILDFGRVFYAYEAVINASREGARYCGLHSRDDTSVVANTQTQVTTELS